jgi:transposase
MKKAVKYVGIDISKLTIDICVKNTTVKNSSYLKLPNDYKGFDAMTDYLSKAFPDNFFYFGFEATGTYMVSLQKFLSDNGLDYVLINPATVSHFVKSKRAKLKTDKHDSFMISDYISTLPDSVFVSDFDAVRNELQRFGSYLEFLTRMEVQVKGFRDSIKSSDVGSDNLAVDVNDLGDYLKAKRSEIEAQGIQLLQTRVPVARAIKDDIAGIGYKTLLHVLPLIYDTSDKYTIKQLQAYVGVNPVPFESGTSVKGSGRISKAGNANARKMLYMSAVASLRVNPTVKAKYDRLLAQGKPKKVALIAVSAQLFRAIVSRLNYYKENPPA